MALPNLVVSPGTLRVAYAYELERFQANDTLKRFWAKDASLWPAKDPRVAMSVHLDWTSLPEGLEGYSSRAVQTAGDIGQEFDDVVLIALGSSNLAAEIVSSLGLFAYGKRFFVLDSIHPEDIRTIERVINPARTLFLLASKTGKVIETHGLLLYFLEKLKASGSNFPGQNFIALTEEDSYLRSLAAQYQFRNLFVDPAGIPGRFSGLIHFTLLLAALCKRDPGTMIREARAMREACGPDVEVTKHPAATLAGLFAAGGEAGYERLAILTHPGLQPLANRLGQLVGTSSCSEGKGILPLFGVGPGIVNTIRGDYIAVCIRLSGMDNTEIQEASARLEEAGVPTVLIDLERVEDLSAELFRWEIATCLACSALGTNPFEAAEMDEGRGLAMDYLNKLSARQRAELPRPRMEQDGLQLFVEGATRREISMLSMREAIRSLFGLLETDAFLGVLSFLPGLVGVSRMESLCSQTGTALGVPVILGLGPRYLQISGQCFKGGPRKGVFLMLTSEIENDIPVPGAGYTFGDLSMAMAMADFDLMSQRGRFIVRLHLTRGYAAGMTDLQSLVESAQVGIRRNTE